MSTIEILIAALLLVTVAVLVLQLIALLRGRGDAPLHARLDALKDDGERLQRTLREEQRTGREELQQGFDRFRGLIGEQLSGMSQQQAERIDGFGLRLSQLTERTDNGMQGLAQHLAEDGRKSRAEASLMLTRFGEQQQQQLATLTGNNEKRLGEVRSTIESRLTQLTERTDAGMQALTQRLVDDARKGREEITTTLNRLGEQQQQRLAAL
ncbi:MAG: DNA recombination protein RmuC, partial [Rhodanobacter sp.]